MSVSSNGGYLSITGSGYYRKIMPTQYFGGTATVTAEWDYTLYYGDTKRHQKVTLTISCYNNQVSIHPTSIKLSPGQTYQLSYSHAYDNQYVGAANAYFSGGNSSFTVTSSGLVTAIKPGSGYVNVYSKVSDASKAPACYVEVVQIDPQSVAIPNNLTVYVGETQTITPTVTPSNAQTSYTWYSTASGKASVSNGVVRGEDEGTAQVYCRTSNGIESNRCNVTVYYRKPTGIEVSPSSVTLNMHQTKQLSYSVKPSNAKTTVTWHSEDTNGKIIKLSSSGLITPVGPGTTRVYAQTDNNYKGYCTVTVLPDPDKIEIPKKILVMYGDKRKIDYKLSPSNAYVQLAWSSDNPTVARVGQDGTIEAVGGGCANITVTTQNGKAATAYVEVPEPNFRMHMWLSDGTTVLYPIKSHPKVQFPDDKVVVSGDGIDAEFDKANFNRLTFDNEMISPMPSSIDMPSSISLTYGDRYQMPYALQPEDFDFVTNLSWTTTDGHVAIVSGNGVVTAVGGGEANIVCEASNGCHAQCRVSVPEPEFYLVVWLKDGRKSVTHLREKPMLKYEADAYALMTTTSETRYDAADVAKITLADNPEGNISGIEDIAGDEAGARPVYALDTETMVISGGSPGASTNVYTVAGLLVATFTADGQGRTVMPLSDLPKGVLIIQSEQLTYKIIKK